MLWILLIIMMVIEIYQILIKRNFLHPLVYFFGIWIICISFALIDYYHSIIEITPLAQTILILGISSFFLGTIFPKLKLKRSNTKYTVEKHYEQNELNYSKVYVSVLLSISLTFNIFMSVLTIVLLRSNIPYSSIRDMFLSYGDNVSFFPSTFFSTFNSWISMPCTYAISIILSIDIFKRKMGKIIMTLMIIDIALFTFATSGRLLILLFAIQVFFCFNYYRVKVSKKNKKRVKKFLLFLVFALIIITVYRNKDTSTSEDNVNSIYSYFAISVPLLSKWSGDSRLNSVVGFGVCTLNGIFEFLHYLYAKLFSQIDNYTAIIDVLSLPQEKWVRIYHNYWANAFCSMFYYFYLDFRELGVIIYSFLFGVFSKKIYSKVCIYRDERYLPFYLVVIQTVFCSFIRWQWGTFTYVVLGGILLFPFWIKMKYK